MNFPFNFFPRQVKNSLILLFCCFGYFGLRAQFTCASATPITDGACLTGQLTSGGFSGGFAGCNGGSNPVHYYSFTAPANGDCAQFNITNPSANGTWEVMIYTAGCGAYVTGSGGCIENVVTGNPFSVSSQDGTGSQVLTAGVSYILILSPSTTTTFDICFTSPSTRLASDACPGAIAFPTSPTTFYNGGDCDYSGSFDNGSSNDPNAATACAGSLENTAWFTFTAANTTNIVISGSNISCTGGGCGFQFGIYSAGIGVNCPSPITLLTNLGCYGDKVCPGGNPTAGPTNPVGRITWSGTGTSGFTATISGVSTGEVFYFLMDGNADADCQFTLDASNNILPVEMLNFQGWQENDHILLKWTTEMEINCKEFNIFKSEDGRDFHEIGSLSGGGNTTTSRSYSFVDPLPQTRLNFYQIRQQDYNGAVKISSVLQVGYNYSDVKVVNQNHELQIQFGISARDHAPLHIRIMSLSGALIYEEKILDPVTVEVIPFDPQTKGIYFLSVTGDHFRYFTRLLSQEN